MPADFGPRVPPDGVEGILVVGDGQFSDVASESLSKFGRMPSNFHIVAQVADPEDACTNISVPVLDHAPWIALIVRSERARMDCSFDVKVSKTVPVLLSHLSYLPYTHELSSHISI